jgi:hypothetical protein
MTILTILLICIASQWPDAGNLFHHVERIFNENSTAPEVIDSTDIIIFSLDKAIVVGHTVEVPIYIQSDEVINALDFSMLLDTGNLEYTSITDHTASLQYAAFFNPNDLKLRFTSNSFSTYPVNPEIVISVKFNVLSDVLKVSDFEMLTGYLNGDRCKIDLQLKGGELAVANKEIIVNETFLHPNPASDELYIQSATAGTLQLFDMNGRAVIPVFHYEGNQVNTVPVAQLPGGMYTARLITGDHVVKTQQVIIQ